MISEMKCNLGEVFVILVCHDDGAVVLTFEEFQQVINIGGEAAQWVSAARSRRQMYLIKGSDGKLAFKIGKDEYAEKIFGLKPPAESESEHSDETLTNLSSATERNDKTTIHH